MTPITLTGISKTYGRNELPVLDRVGLAVGAGELFFLLGPSGCGKSTLLRIVAGLLAPSAGTVHFGAEEVTRLPTERRQTALVFQNYALWPHLDVLGNVRFGLEARRLPQAEAEARAREALAQVGMSGHAARRPAALSGGEQQRVALARALAVRPRVLLLDEPLSNLDARLRLAMRQEIRRICREAGLTALYVTHDQQEALAMADRLAVLHGGRIRQVGTPREIYRRPASRFVADFIGEGNFLPATLAAREPGRLLLRTPLGLLAADPAAAAAELAPGAELTVLLRPEALAPAPDEADNAFAATLVDATFLGEVGRWTVEAAGLRLLVAEPNPPPRRHGERLRLRVAPADVVPLPPEPGPR